MLNMFYFFKNIFKAINEIIFTFEILSYLAYFSKCKQSVNYYILTFSNDIDGC